MNPNLIKLRVLEQDYETLRGTLGVPGFVRVKADTLDFLVLGAITFALHLLGANPLFALVHLVVRDATPWRRSIGKLVCGIGIYSFPKMKVPTVRELLKRGLANALILVPFALLTVAFMGVMIAGWFFAGLIFIFLRGNSALMRAIGYDVDTGRTVADWVAGTHLIYIRDLESLNSMRARIERLRDELALPDQTQGS